MLSLGSTIGMPSIGDGVSSGFIGGNAGFTYIYLKTRQFFWTIPRLNFPKQFLAFFTTIRRSKNALEARFRAPNSLNS